MTEGEIILTSIQQADGVAKNRPAILLRELPRYRDFLVCGLSTQLQQRVPDFDEIISASDPDFAGSGLLHDSLIRLAFLAVLPRTSIIGAIGSISPQRHQRLLTSLAGYLTRDFENKTR
jgi:mRNA interferase MazF